MRLRPALAGSAAILILLLGTATPAAASTNYVSVRDNLFAPADIRVQVGDRVLWTNLGAPVHTVTSDDGVFDSGTLGAGGSFVRTFDSAGVFFYTCRAVGTMSGVVEVIGSGPGTIVGSPAASPTTGGTGTLPRTGPISGVGIFSLLGMVLLAAGAALMFAVRRRPA